MTAEQKAKAMIAERSTKNLIDDFILSGDIDDPNIFTVRGLIMDELEARDSDAFMNWLDQDDPTDESLKSYFQ